jgi:hypothetical protein
MKKLLPSLFALCVPALVSAQITIEQTDFPAIGDLYFEATDTLPSQSLGLGSASGSSQSWNFTTLNQHRLDSLAFLNPTSVPNGDQFPTADLAFTQLGGFAFASINSSEVEIVGFSGDFQGLGFVLQIPFTDPQTLVKLPSTYGTTFSDNNYFKIAFKLTGQFAAFVDSAMIVHRGRTEAIIDAFGTLTGPLGTYEVLRNNATDWTTDSIFIKGGLFGPQNWALANFQQFGQNIANPLIDSTITYDFLEKSVGYTMVRVIKDKGTGEITSARSLVNPGSIGDVTNMASVLVYPNPASEYVNVEFNGNKTATAYLLNLNGQILREVFLVVGKNEIPTADLNNGLYLLQVKGENGKNLLNSKISVSK